MMTKKRKKLSPDQIKQNRDQRAFSKKIISVFRNMGFQHLPTQNIHRFFGPKEGELDFCFLFENILIVAEDTITEKHDKIKDHLKNKFILFSEINKNKPELLDWLRGEFPEKFGEFQTHVNARYKVFYLYFTKFPSQLTEKDLEMFRPTIIMENDNLNYFHKITSNIKLSSRHEFFRFLQLSRSQIGAPASAGTTKDIERTIIAPEDNTKLKCGARLISFMLSAETLIKNSYVLRKDSWEASSSLYQRLIESGRIKSIREFLAKNQEAFINNVIVSLSSQTRFQEFDKTTNTYVDKDIDQIADFDNCKVIIPDEINSIGIIDGQHRIYAHYEGDEKDKYEKQIKPLRDKLHLLVTGLVFPKNTTQSTRISAESDIFLNINSTSKGVPQDVLLHIESTRDPFSSIGISRRVLEKLNKNTPFLGLFELSLMKKSRIKSSSIIKFVLKHMVDTDESKETFYKYWPDTNKNKLLIGTPKEKEELLNAYTDFVSQYIQQYFSAVQAVFHSSWYNIESKILSITSINGFLIALKLSLSKTGIQGKEYYEKILPQLKIDFNAFPYTSSQYNPFSRQVLEEVFDIKTSEDSEKYSTENDINTAE